MVAVYNAGPGWGHTHQLTLVTAQIPDVVKATGAVANATAINASTLTGSCSVGCDGDHANGCSAVANLVQASGASKATLTVVDTSQFPATTGGAL